MFVKQTSLQKPEILSAGSEWDDIDRSTYQGKTRAAQTYAVVTALRNVHGTRVVADPRGALRTTSISETAMTTETAAAAGVVILLVTTAVGVAAPITAMGAVEVEGKSPGRNAWLKRSY